jgi:hypothetical protein
MAFEDVTVVPMDTERLLPHQTVFVRDGRIRAQDFTCARPHDAASVASVSPATRKSKTPPLGIPYGSSEQTGPMRSLQA